MASLTPPARVLSVGPDGRPGNADDVVIPVEGRAAVNAAAALASSASVAASAPAGSMVAPEARRTFEDLTRLASGLASFKAANGFYPVTEGADQLERWLVPDHVAPSRWVGHDGWDRPWRYRVTDVGSSYSLASAGADGRWESLVPPHPAGAPDDGDIVVSDGVFLRWPAGLSPPTAAPAAGVKAASDGASDPAPEAPADLTAWRLRRLGASVAAARHDAGRYPESDDALRLFGDLGSRVQPVDGWGRELDYLSLASGSSFVLVSAGADGIQERSTEDYARGAPPQGDDILVRDGVLSPGTPPPAP